MCVQVNISLCVCMCTYVCAGSAHAQDIYKFTRMAIDKAVNLTRYEVPRGIYVMCMLLACAGHMC